MSRENIIKKQDVGEAMEQRELIRSQWECKLVWSLRRTIKGSSQS